MNDATKTSDLFFNTRRSQVLIRPLKSVYNLQLSPSLKIVASKSSFPQLASVRRNNWTFCKLIKNLVNNKRVNHVSEKD